MEDVSHGRGCEQWSIVSRDRVGCSPSVGSETYDRLDWITASLTHDLAVVSGFVAATAHECGQHNPYMSRVVRTVGLGPLFALCRVWGREPDARAITGAAVRDIIFIAGRYKRDATGGNRLGSEVN